MKILHVQGFTQEERREKANEIRRNVIESIRVSVAAVEILYPLTSPYSEQDITSHMSRLEPPIALKDPENQQFVQVIRDFPSDGTEPSDAMFDATERLWADAGVQESYQRSNEYQLIDCAK